MSCYYDSLWLYKKHKLLFEDSTGANLTNAENNALKTFFDTEKSSPGKEIYYMAILRIKRSWPIFLVYLFICFSLKKKFNQDESLQTLAPLNKIFAKNMLNDAIKAYCKIGD